MIIVKGDADGRLKGEKDKRWWERYKKEGEEYSYSLLEYEE